jgi:tricarballylate dehydrogenase
MKQVWGEAADNFLIRGTPYNEGHVLQALMSKGAATVGDASQCHAVAIDARGPKFDGGIVTRLDCVPFSVVVNNAGERFYDEGEDFWPKRYAIWGRLIAALDNQIAYSIFDSKVTSNFMPSVYPPIKAATLGALADELGLPADQLNTTVGEYNAAVVTAEYDPRILDDCSTQGLDINKSHWALPINEPPFYAYPLRPGITFTYLGVQVNATAQVKMSNGPFVDNLYAAGEVMAGNVLGRGYCAGTGMTIGGVFGRIAGAQAACHSK